MNTIKKIQSGLLLSLFVIGSFIPSKAHAEGGISFDSATGVLDNTSSVNLDVHIDEAGEMLLCFASDNTVGNSDDVSFDGTPMSNLTSVESYHGYFKLWAFYLANPTVGTSTAVFNRSSSNPSSNWWVHCAAYKKASQLVPEAFSTLADETGTTHEMNLTTHSNNAWTVMYALADGGGLATSTGSTLRDTVYNGASGLFDSSGGITPPGSTAMDFLTNNGEATGIMVSLAPALSFDSTNALYTVEGSTDLDIHIDESNETLVCFTSDDELTNTDDASVGSSSMTTLTSIESTHGYFKLWAFYSQDPAIGTTTVSFNRTTSNPSSNWWVHCAAYKNANIPEAYAVSAESNGTVHTGYIQTQNDYAWSVMYGLADAGSMAAGSGSTLRGEILNTASGLFDSNGPIPSATSTSMSFTSGNGEGTKILLSLPQSN